MAQTKPQSFRLRALTGLVETTEGVDATPATSNGIRLFNGIGSITRPITELQEDRPFFGNYPFSVGDRVGMVKGDIMLFPPSAPGNAGATGDPASNIILLPGGFTPTKNAGAKTTRLNPISLGIVSASYYWYHAGEHWKLLGSRNRLTNIKTALDSRWMLSFETIGNTTGVSAAAVPSITKPAGTARVATTANSVAFLKVNGGSELAAWSQEFDLQLAAELNTIPFTNDAKFNDIDDRLPTFSILMAPTDQAEFNPDAVIQAESLFEYRWRTFQGPTTAAGLYTEVGVRGQLENYEVVEVKRKKLWRLTGKCIPSDSGGDECYVLYGDSTT